MFGRTKRADREAMERGTMPEEIRGRSHAPMDIDYSIAHRRMVFLFRMSVSVNVVLLAVVSILASILHGLFPLKEIQLGLLRMDDPTSRVVWVEPVRKDVEGVELFVETHIKRFILNTQTIDGHTEAERFQEAIWMSGSRVWEEFKRERITSGAVQKAIDAGLARSVTVNVVQKIESFNRTVDKYRAEFVMVDRVKGRETDRKVVEGIFSIALLPKEVSVEHRYMNPLGVSVVDFSMRFKEQVNDG